MPQEQTFVHDERILRALVRLTRGARHGWSEDLDTVEPPPDSESSLDSAPSLDSEPLHDDAIDMTGWDVVVRSRPPRP